MFDNKKIYTLRMDINGCITRYFISFTDGQGVRRETEVSHPIYLEFLRFVRIERNFRRSDERHIEKSELTEETLNRRMLRPPESVEETVLDSQRNERLRQAVADLPETQRWRFVLHHKCGLTYEQIAEIEGCSFQAVAKSIKAAENSIKKNF
jgi:RNA polymerase sigma-70 factor (ECF subfamily)